MATITIYTQVYNKEKYIEECILSVLNQTYKDFEYIIVDNGSSDKSRNIIEKYAKKDMRIKTIYLDENKKGFWPYIIKEKACGQYISILDADDYIDKNFFMEMINFAKTKKTDMVICGSEVYIEKTKKKEVLRMPNNNNIFSQNEFDSIFPYIHVFLRTTWAKLFTYDVFKKANTDLFDKIALNGGYGADTVFVVDLFSRCKKIGLYSKLLHTYRMSSSSVSYKYSHTRNECNRILYFQSKNILEVYGKISDTNKLFIERVYINSIMDDINIIKNSSMSIYKKLDEFAYLLKDELIQNIIKINCNDYSVKTLKNNMGQLINYSDKNNNTICRKILVIILLVNNELSYYINEKNMKHFFYERKFIQSCINLNSICILESAIENLSNNILVDSLWEGICSKFKKNIFLNKITTQAFVYKYKELIMKIYKGEFVNSLKIIKQVVFSKGESEFEKEVLFLFVNIAALLEEADDFILAKKLQAKLFIKTKEYSEAEIVLNDLIEMCPYDEEVIDLRRKYEYEYK